MKRAKKGREAMKPFGWVRDRWRCDFCERRILDVRAKVTHSSGLVIFACLGCARAAGVFRQVGGAGGGNPL